MMEDDKSLRVPAVWCSSVSRARVLAWASRRSAARNAARLTGARPGGAEERAGEEEPPADAVDGSGFRRRRRRRGGSAHCMVVRFRERHEVNGYRH